MSVPVVLFSPGLEETTVSWAALFERAESVDVDEELVRATLDRLRGEDGDAA